MGVLQKRIAGGFGFIAALMLQLNEEGTIRLNDPISKWLPKYPKADKMTIKMLLGLLRAQQGTVRVFGMDPVRNPVEVVRRVRDGR